MIRVVWPDHVLAEIHEIVEYIRNEDPIAAGRIGDDLIVLCDSLATFPHRGRPAADGTREMTKVRPFIPRYRIEGDAVTILRVGHGVRRPAD